MFEEILKQAEEMIKDNFRQYREQFKKESQSFSEALKKEYVLLKTYTKNMIDEVIAEFEQKLESSSEEVKEKIKEGFKEDSIKIHSELSEINKKIEMLIIQQQTFEINIEQKINDLEKKSNEKILNIEKGINLNIKEYIDKNSKEIRNKLINSIFKKI